MFNYILRSFFYSLLIILGVMTVTFGVIRLLPGDPARLMMGQRADLQSVEALRKQWKLDQPVYVQYADFMVKAATGDFGRSFAFNRPVLETILEKVPATAYLAVSSLAIASLLGIAIGVLSAWRPYTLMDNASMVFALLGISVPVFVLGLTLIIVT